MPVPKGTSKLNIVPTYINYPLYPTSGGARGDRNFRRIFVNRLEKEYDLMATTLS